MKFAIFGDSTTPKCTAGSSPFQSTRLGLFTHPINGGKNIRTRAHDAKATQKISCKKQKLLAI